MENRRLVLIGGLGMAGVGVFAALIGSAMRGTVPEVVTSNERLAEPAPIVQKAEPAVSQLAAQEAEPVTANDLPASPQVDAKQPKPAQLPKRTALAKAAPVGVRPEAKVSKQEAREALAGVGANAAAEVVWWMAINDLSLDPEVRKDLIEDLNEDGFSDPKHPGREDLPLIESRITLIEELADETADDTNLEAFGEAYKDLLNMRARLTAR